eukprot:scaffold4475_cov277-Chaetoceros_neogracile.AAC.5
MSSSVVYRFLRSRKSTISPIAKYWKLSVEYWILRHTKANPAYGLQTKSIHRGSEIHGNTLPSREHGR